MASEFVGLRLNYKKDADILDAISNAKNRTKELKKLMRLGIQASQGSVYVEREQPIRKSKEISISNEPIDWTPQFKDKEPVKKNITANILGGFD